MSKWRYVRYRLLMLFGTMEVLTIWALVLNPVLVVPLCFAICMWVFLIYAVLANWEDESEENATKTKKEEN